ncbi:MAG: FAD-dependent oxidoreductase [Desulfobacula sp.]|nr:FAD-dependent oxidoreductase [Desulfobacula sp.]
MKSNQDIIIVGGGIIGLACAHYLLKQNKSVRIIEQDKIGSGASHGNCGLLHFSGIIPLCAPGVVSHEFFRVIRGTSPLYIKPQFDIKLFHWLYKFAGYCNAKHMNAAAKAKNQILSYSLELFETLFSSIDLNCDFEKKGLLTLFKNQSYFDKYAKTNAFLEKFNMGGRPLTPSQIQDIEPAIKDDIAGAWLNPHDWHLRPEKLIEAWKKKLIQKGLIIEEKTKLIDFNIQKKKIAGVNTIKGRFKADAYIIASGAWAAKIKEQLNLKCPVQPGKGYSITMEQPDIAPTIPCLLYERNMVATPWTSGFRLGGTMEFSGYNDTLNKKRLAKLIFGAKEYLNTTMDQPIVEEWTGLRPMTFDDLPIIGPVSHMDNLILATGHGMLGITMATGTGKAVCDLLTNGKPSIDLTAFSPDRF